MNSTHSALSGEGMFAQATASAASGGFFNVKQYGAKGDGSTIDSPAIDKAIEAASNAGGGTVYFPAGTYNCYTIHLKSNVTLHVESGATIQAALPPPEGEPGGYDAPEPNPADKYQDFGHSHWRNSLIYGEDLENIAITGMGMIFGKGLSHGGKQDVSPLPDYKRFKTPQFWSPENPPDQITKEEEANPDTPFGYPDAEDTQRAGVGNKAIALKNCRNVFIRDVTIFHGGHMAILVTGVDNLTCDNLKIDTNRDGIDIDCCWNVRVSNCWVNAAHDDAICPKSSFALGYVRPTQNVLITNCLVTGYDEGTMLDGTCRHATDSAYPNGRIKLGTEANGGFRNITISNCVFDCSKGIALESVDGGLMEDITITNITMRTILNSPIFIRLGARLRGPGDIAVGTAQRIKISHVTAYNVFPDHGILIAGIPGHPVQDISLSDISIVYQGGGTAQHAARKDVPEYVKGYPDPRKFGILPSYGLYARHVEGLTVRDLSFKLLDADVRPAVILNDVKNAFFDHFSAPAATGGAVFDLEKVSGFSLIHSDPIPDKKYPTDTTVQF